jgi:hypothetical protein
MPIMMWKIRSVDSSFIETAPWVFKAEMELDCTAQEAFDIVAGSDSNESSKHWQPEVQNIQWDDSKQLPRGRVGAVRTILYNSFLSYVFLGGPCTLEETIDGWDDGGGGEGGGGEHATDMNMNSNTKKTYSFSFTAMARPPFMMWYAGREDFSMEPILDDNHNPTNKCKLTRICSFEPAFIMRYVFGCIIYRNMKYVFEEKTAQALVKAVREKTLPLRRGS